MGKVGQYKKFIVAGFGALVVILGRQFGVTSTLVLDVITLGTAAGVYVVPNDKP